MLKLCAISFLGMIGAKAGSQAKHDLKRSAFVGNLAFDIDEESLWNFFEECGEIGEHMFVSWITGPLIEC